MNALMEIKNQKGLTVQDMASLSDVPLSTVYAHLNGTRKIGHRAARKYVRLGVPLEKLLEVENGEMAA